MAFLVLVGVLFGTFLSQFFKWYILFPAIGLVAVLAGAGHLDNSPSGSLLQFIVLTVSLQLGYFAGLIAPMFLQSAPSLSIDLVRRHVDEVASVAGDRNESIKSATRSIAD